MSTAGMPRRATSTGPWTLAVLALLLVAAPLGLLLTGGPAGAAAQALPRAPEAEADGRSKKLPTCATVSVISGERGTCKVKKDGKVLIIKDPLVAVLKDGEVESSALGPNRFVKQWAKWARATNSGLLAVDDTMPENLYICVDAQDLQGLLSALRSGIDLEHLDLSGDISSTQLRITSMGYNSNNKKLTLKAAPSDREALAALDPAAGPCVLEFRTPCGEDGEDGGPRCPRCEGIICPGGVGFSPTCDECAFSGPLGEYLLEACVCCCSRSDCQFY